MLLIKRAITSSLYPFFCGFFCLAIASLAEAQTLAPYAYSIGEISVIDYYVNPQNGSDSNTGRSEEEALRTVQRAWQQIPTNVTLTKGYRINLAGGVYGSDDLPNYWENRKGTARAPIILQRSPTTNGDVRFARDINMANVNYFYLIGIEIVPEGGGDTFHCERCDHLLLRGSKFNGGSMTNGAHETIKINQSQFVFLENNQIAFADDNAIDFVGVQYGHIIGNKIHSAQDWCVYVKGGSAYIRIESNEISNCGTGGFTAGQGSGFQFMTSPWLHYEAYDIKFINNLVYDTTGAAFGVNGGYNILLAHNSAYNVGRRSHVMEVVFGERTCDGETNGSANAQCASYNALGGWGAASTKTTPDPIGNRNVFIINNVIVNPDSVVAPQHFAIYGPRSASRDTNIPSEQRTDVNLVIKGNLIVNGDASTPVGVEDESQGCQPANPTCSLTQLLRDNSFNTKRVTFRSPASGDLRPLSGADPLFAQQPSELLSFLGGDRELSPEAPQGELRNDVTRDFGGAARSSSASVVGAFLSVDSSRTPPVIDNAPLPGDPTDDPDAPEAPTVTISSISVTQVRTKKRIALSLSAAITGAPGEVRAEVKRKKRSLRTGNLSQSKPGRYVGKLSLSLIRGEKVTVTVTATDAAGLTTSKTKNVTVR